MRKTLSLFALGLSCNLFAQPVTDQALLEKRLAAIFGHNRLTIEEHDAVLKRVMVDGGSAIYFATHSGQYVFAGPIYDTEQKLDIVAEMESFRRRAILDALPENLLVRYPSTQPNASQITVITDIDCPYCREFHTQIPQLNEQGISVNYLMLPRAGLGSKSYQKTLNALCSDNVSDAITLAMQNSPSPSNVCSPDRLNEHIATAKRLKVTATPGVVLPNGELKLGLLKPAELQNLIHAGS